MAALGCEVARADAEGVVAGADDHRLGHHAARHIAEAHALARGQAQRFQAAHQRGIAVELGGRFAPAQTEVGRAHDHQRHRRVDAGDVEAVDRVDAPAGREQRARHRAPGVEEIQADRRGRAGDAIDAGRAVVDHAATGREHGDVDARTGVDVEHAHRRLAIVRRHQPLLDRERRHAREHVAAIGPRVDRLLPDADLGEKVVDVAARLGRARDDGHLAGQRAAAADAVDMQQVRSADGADQRLIAHGLVGGQPVAQEEGPARGAGAHQGAGECHRGHGQIIVAASMHGNCIVMMV